jgi:hypothetical protein
MIQAGECVFEYRDFALWVTGSADRASRIDGSEFTVLLLVF